MQNEDIIQLVEEHNVQNNCCGLMQNEDIIQPAQNKYRSSQSCGLMQNEDIIQQTCVILRIYPVVV